MAHKKGQSSSKNGRESQSKRLGFKKFGGEVVKAGNIIAFVNVTLSSFNVILVSACGRAFMLTVNAKSRRKQSRPRIFCRILCLFFMFCEIWFLIDRSLI